MKRGLVLAFFLVLAGIVFITPHIQDNKTNKIENINNSNNSNIKKDINDNVRDENKWKIPLMI